MSNHEEIRKAQPTHYCGSGERFGATVTGYYTAEQFKVLVDELERTERNRDMWKGQVERQARRLERMCMVLADHNADCINQCDARKKIGKSSCYMLGYDRECGDCPRDGMIDLAAIDSAMAGEGVKHG